MSTHNFQPGDVAMVTGRWIRTEDHTERYAVKRPGGWWSRAGGIADHEVSVARPLVVIDLEDREQVERLAKAFLAEFPTFHSPSDTDAMQAALREFADPTPPKPDEPTGLGAVVEDVEGVRWVRNPDAAVICKWRNADREWRGYDRINAVRVLSPGVEDGAS